jgi:hypothetical protein
MWDIWLDWQALNQPEDFSIEYPDTFDMRDEHLELDFLMKARSAGVSNEMFQNEISKQVVALTVDDDALQSEILADMDKVDFEAHEMTDPVTGAVVIARSQEEHLGLAALGYKHEGE